MLTEEDARAKWCPANRWGQDPLAMQPHEFNPVPCRCIASECMAWRWVGTRIAFFDGDNGSGCSVQTPTGKSGYCGLAGRPEVNL